MSGLLYEVPSRIHMGLYDLTGELGRVDGGIGFSLSSPQLKFTASKSDEIVLQNSANLAPELCEAVKSGLNQMQDRYGLGGIILTFVEGIPAHSGFGSKTATVVSTAHAYATIYNNDLKLIEIVGILGRGGTSGIGVNTIYQGGFILDGGHNRRNKPGFAPSSATVGVETPPVLARYDMPDWDVLLVMPHLGQGYGAREVSFFEENCPIPTQETEQIARIILSQVLPGVATSDLEQFCDGVNALQDVGFKAREIGQYGKSLKTNTILQIMASLHELGFKGVGMSSMGPLIYALGPGDLDRVEDVAQGAEIIKVSKPNNNGLNITQIE
jgi:beta-ribofuranosylaminobenzene 5'-phosphate synthase